MKRVNVKEQLIMAKLKISEIQVEVDSSREGRILVNKIEKIIIKFLRSNYKMYELKNVEIKES